MIAWSVEALAASASLMVAVLLLRAPVRRMFGPQVAYALWALPALRLALPPLPETWSRAAATPISAAGEAVVLILPLDAAATPAAEAGGGLPWGAVLLATWAMGAAVFLLLHFVRHHTFCRRVLREAEIVGELEGVRVVESPAAAGPLAFGVVRRYIAFPADMAVRYDADERALALAHEMGHHARRDLHANWAALGVLALHWWNPVAWAAHRAFRCDQELANDAHVMAGRSRTDRHAYACAIMKAAGGGALAPACHLHAIADLKGRLKMLSIARPSRTRLATGTTAVVALVAAGLFATASGTRAAAAVGERIEAATDVALQAAPAVPPSATNPSASPTTATPVAPEAFGKRALKRVVVVKDGVATTYEGADAEAYAVDNGLSVPPVPPAPGASPRPPAPPVPPTVERVVADAEGRNEGARIVRRWPGAFTVPDVPEVSARACRDGVDGPASRMFLQKREGDKSVMVICSNRIERVTEESAATAIRAEEARVGGLETALASIESARASIRTNRDLAAEQRRQVLDGLENATRELRDDLRSRD